MGKTMDIIYLSDLKIDTVIGIYDWERRITQTVSFDLRYMSDDPRDTLAATGLMSLILALPLAAILAIRRRLPQRLASLSPKDGGV